MLSVILPTYNEKDNLPVLVNMIDGACKKAGIRYEIIVVDDNSPDGTGSVADEISKNDRRVRVVHRKEKRGLGSAVLDGARISKGEYICIMDADLQHDPDDIPKLYGAAQRGSIAIGSRYVKGGRSELGFARSIVSRGAAFLARIMLGISVRDPESGFSVIRKDLFDRIVLNPRGFKINLEIMHKSGEKVAEVPVTLRKRVHGKTKLGAKEFVNYILLLLELRSLKRIK